MMNFVNNSYILEIQNSRDPNITIANGAWFAKWPSYLKRSVQPVCQPQEFSINSQFFTNQSGFEYTLLYVGDKYRPSAAAPSISYFNNPLEDCKLRQIQFHFERNRPESLSMGLPWAGEMRAVSTCRISGGIGSTQIYISALYKPMSIYWLPGSSTFIATDSENKAALFWAEILLNGLFYNTMLDLDHLFHGPNNSVVGGDVMLTPHRGKSHILSSKFFHCEYSLILKNDSRHFGTGRIEYSAYAPPTSGIWKKTVSTMDLLAKAMYSTVLADLGSTFTGADSNILLMNDTVIRDLLYEARGLIIVTGLGGVSKHDSLALFHATQSGNLKRDPPVLTPSVISTSYQCQVPKLKSGGEILISILVADLVLLSAAWQVFTLAVKWLALNKRPEAHYCEGCSNMRVDDGTEMESLPKAATNSMWSIVESKRASIASRIDK